MWLPVSKMIAVHGRGAGPVVAWMRFVWVDKSGVDVAAVRRFMVRPSLRAADLIRAGVVALVGVNVDEPVAAVHDGRAAPGWWRWTDGGGPLRDSGDARVVQLADLVAGCRGV